MTILDELADYARVRVEKSKELISEKEMEESAFSLPKGDYEFEKALDKPGVSFICECKKASPSKGVIAEDFPYLQIAKEYEQAGADAISVLTEPKWFLGKNEYLNEITQLVKIPCIRKDFVVDSYMIHQAKTLGAAAVLLIVSILEKRQIEEYLDICYRLGMSALVECHDEAEIDTAVSAGARIIGVNNRNLKDFSVDVNLTSRLRDAIPADVIMVSESGLKNKDDIRILRDMGVDAALIGEALMRAPDKREMLGELKQAGR